MIEVHRVLFNFSCFYLFISYNFQMRHCTFVIGDKMKFPIEESDEINQLGFGFDFNFTSPAGSLQHQVILLGADGIRRG